MLSIMIAMKDKAMGQLLVRNLDDAVVERLKRQAEARKISLEQFLRELLSRAAGPTRAEMLAEADRIRSMTPKPLTDDSTDLIRADRDRR
jgi:antitoxin FitA